MEFIFELFAEILGRSEEQPSAAPVEMVEAEEAEVVLEEQEQVEIQPVNIFNVVNFH